MPLFFPSTPPTVLHTVPTHVSAYEVWGDSLVSKAKSLHRFPALTINHKEGRLHHILPEKLCGTERATVALAFLVTANVCQVSLDSISECEQFQRIGCWQYAHTVTLSIWLLPRFFQNNNQTDQDRAIARKIGILLEDFLIIDHSEEANDQTNPFKTSALRDNVFNMVKPRDWTAEHSPSPAGLVTPLFHYQQRALRWILWRESFVGKEIGSKSSKNSISNRISMARKGKSSAFPPSSSSAAAEGTFPPDSQSTKAFIPEQSFNWQPCTLSSGLELYWNISTGETSLTLPHEDPTCPEVVGGILAEEMGLGKSIEIIAACLANKPPANRLQKDITAEELMEGGLHDQTMLRGMYPGGTLIICPPALLEQWKGEFKRHTNDALKVIIYRGMDKNANLKGTAAEKRESIMQREGKLLDMMRNGEEVEPSFNPNESAQIALDSLLEADVVLTSFNVLRDEVYYTGEKIRNLRRAKRYPTPVCPLLQVSWWRCVCDEAQMVGPFNAAGQMLDRMTSHIRWCVTGTPMGNHQLDDIRDLMFCLQHPVFSDQRMWSRLIGRDDNADKAILTYKTRWDNLVKLLRPMMWRNDKSVIALEHQLPKRTLHVVKLNFKPGEREFYHELVGKTRSALNGGEGSKNSKTRSKKPANAAAGGRKRKRVFAVAANRNPAADYALTELRLCCLHPQLTQHWKEGAKAELQNQDGALSMEEILIRILDKRQFELQEKERCLCEYLTTYGMVLLGIADGGAFQDWDKKINNNNNDTTPGSPTTTCGGGGFFSTTTTTTNNGAGPSSSIEANTKQATTPTTSPSGAILATGSKKQRASKKSAARQQTEYEKRIEALTAFEKAYCIYDKGIDGYSRDISGLVGLPEPPPLPSASVLAWKKTQIATCGQLAVLYGQLGRKEEAEVMLGKKKKHMNDIKALALMEVTNAQQRFEMNQAQLQSVRNRVITVGDQARSVGFPPGWGVSAKGNKAWLARIEDSFAMAKEREKEELQLLLQENAHIEKLLGSIVQETMASLETEVQGEITVLEQFLSIKDTLASLDELKKIMKSLPKIRALVGDDDGEDDEDDSERSVALVATMKEMLGRHVRLFPPFRALTLYANWTWILPDPRKPLSFPVIDDNYGGTATITGTIADMEAKVQVLDKNDKGKEADGPSTTATTSIAPPPIPPPPPRPSAVALIKGEEVPTALVQGYTSNLDFIASPSWQGPLKGYVFKTSRDNGLGYHRDRVKAKVISLNSMRQCAQQVLKGLMDQRKKLDKLPIDANRTTLLEKAGLPAVRAKLDSAQTQLSFIRLLKESHVAGAKLRYETALLNDMDAELEDVARRAPEKIRSKDAIRKNMRGLINQAQNIRGTVRYLKSELAQVQSQGDDEYDDDGGGGDGMAIDDQGPSTSKAAQQQQQQQQQERLITTIPADPGSPKAGIAIGPRGPAAGAAADGGATTEHGRECPICLDVIKEEIHLFIECGHAYCKDCSGKVVGGGTCAVCRVKVTVNQIARVPVANNNRRNKKGGGMNKGLQALPDPDAAEGPFKDISITGDWSSKFEGVLRRVLGVLQQSPGEKCLLFSQFTEALTLFGLALKSNGVKFTSLLGGGKKAVDAVKEFNSNDDVEVFLLSQKAGGQGLTLVRANHVFLLEPTPEPAIHQQAVARVHRIGQKRPVHVYRTLLNGSIEEDVVSMQEARHRLFDDDGETGEMDTVATAVGREEIEVTDMEQLLEAAMVRDNEVNGDIGGDVDVDGNDDEDMIDLT